MAQHKLEMELKNPSFDLDIKVLSRLQNAGYTIADRDGDDYFLEDAKDGRIYFTVILEDGLVTLRSELEINKAVEIYKIIEDEVNIFDKLYL